MHMSEKEFEDLIKRKPELIKKEKPAKKKAGWKYGKKSDPLTEIKKNNKYFNQKVWIYDGIPYFEKLPDKKTKMVFDSKKEYNRWLELQVLLKSGEISNLSRQTILEIIPDFIYENENIKGINYKADFMYENKTGKIIVEDVKPLDEKTGKFLTTKDFNLKWKLLKNKYPEYEFRIV